MSGSGDEIKSKDLIACLKNLKMDEKKDFDTSLAEEYLKNYKPKVYPDKIDETKQDKKSPLDDSISKAEMLKRNRQNIAEKVIVQLVKNSELLAQLDYLIRGTNPEYVKKVDLPILIGCFEKAIHADILNDNLNKILYYPSWASFFPITIEGRDPLSKLGQIANILCHTVDIVIWCSKKTSAICQLFVDLCMEAGMPSDYIRLVPIENDGETDVDKSLVNGCIAAVTAKSDIDSAIHTLLNSTSDSKYPWKLRRIFVQENIYDKFKANLKHLTSEKIPEDHLYLKSNAFDVQMYEEKLIVFDYFGKTSLDWEKPIVYIEAYRTIKELLSLLIKYPSDFLSVWCNDISTTNEVTSKCNAQLIWINNIADFQGSNMLSHIVYGLPPFNEVFNKVIKINLLDGDDVKIGDDWSKKTYEERKNILLRAFCNDEHQLFIRGWRPPSFYETSDGRCISGTVQPTGLEYFSFENETFKTYPLTIACIGSLLIGNFICVSTLSLRDAVGLGETTISTLRELGVPVITAFKYFPDYPRTYKYKIIVSYFGETFAN